MAVPRTPSHTCADGGVSLANNYVRRTQVTPAWQASARYIYRTGMEGGRWHRWLVTYQIGLPSSSKY